jgi:GntR family transcriptional regulator, arabinose operon transcriptional repressor
MSMLQRQSDAPPLHVQLANIFKDRIIQGVWGQGETIPTEKELCAEFDVARGTVRQALQALEADGFLRREQGRGTFVIFGNLPPQTPKAARNRVAFIVPYVRDSSVLTILMGFQQAAERENYSVAFHHVNNDVEQQAEVIDRLYQEGVAGIALYPVDSEVIKPLDRFVQAGFPLVLIDRYLKHLSTDFVMTDHFSGALRAVRYLLDQGHRNIGFVTWLSPAVSMEHRFLGYQQALREYGIEPNPALVCHVEGYPTIDLTSLRTYLSKAVTPSAVFAANDQIAIALYRAAASVGVIVPADLAIVGFDNLDIAEQLSPPLTTVAQQFLEIGQKAAEVLFRRIQGDDSPFYQVTISSELIVRDSCLPYAGMPLPLPQVDQLR